MPRRVKAAVMTGPGAIEIQEFPYPRLEPGAMIMRVEMAGVCGTDKHTYRGENQQYAGTEGERTTPFPIIPGHENVGVVADISKEATEGLEFCGNELKEGDRVVMCPDVICGACWYCRHIDDYAWCENVRGYGNAFSTLEPPSLFGGWAEYMYIRPDVFVYKVPETVPVEVAVLAEPFTVALALDDTRAFSSLASKGTDHRETVVIQGVGPLGLCCLIRARILGAAEIVAVDLSDFRLAMAQQFSADHTLNARSSERADRIAYVKSLTKGRGADMVIGCTNVPETVIEGLEMLRKGGTYVEFGNFVDTGATSINVHRHICAKNVRLVGVTNHPFTRYGTTLRMLEEYGRQFPFEKMVTHRYRLDNAEAALLKSMDADSMKVVIEP